MEIFSKVQVGDLIALSDTCERFRTIVFAVMPYCNIDISLVHLSRDRCQRFFITFGKLLMNLTVRHTTSCNLHNCPRCHEVFKLVIEYCGPKLTTLSFVGLALGASTTITRQPKFIHLKSFQTNTCSLPDTFYEFLKRECKDLVHLGTDYKVLLEHRFSHLQSVVIQIGYSDDLSKMYEFVANHNTLKEIRLKLFFWYRGVLPDFDPIKNINKIAVGPKIVSAINFMQFSTWKHIKSLRISGMHIGIPSFIHKMASIKCLQILEMHGILVNNHLIKGIARFKNLERLHLFQASLIGSYLIDWKSLAVLQNLSELKIGGYIDIDHRDLVDLAMSLPKLKLFDLTFLSIRNLSKACKEIAEIGRNRNQPIVVLLNGTFRGNGSWNVEIETDATALS